MVARIASSARAEAPAQGSWLPLIVILVAQIQMSFNVTALTVSVGGIVHTFDTSPTSVGTALV
ncbi:MFS transporter, partial [Escherichia coli]